MKIGITGSSGFVGKNLMLYLSNYKVDIETMSLRNNQFKTVLPVDAYIHLAGKAHDLKEVTQPDEYYHVNFELTKQLYDAFLLSKAMKFIFISSVKAAADSVAGILTEDIVPNPRTHYGRSKLMAEEYIQSRPLPEGKSYYIIRPSMIHGSGNKGNLNLLYQFVAKGIPYPLAAFENKRSFLSVENLCFVIKEIIERSDIKSGIYHLADDEPLSTTSDLIKIISMALDKQPRLWKVPVAVIKGIAKIGDHLHLPLTSERLKKLTENYVVSNQKIKIALGKELPLSASEGILKTARAFKNA